MLEAFPETKFPLSKVTNNFFTIKNLLLERSKTYFKIFNLIERVQFVLIMKYPINEFTSLCLKFICFFKIELYITFTINDSINIICLCNIFKLFFL